jgi:hypothetical protein
LAPKFHEEVSWEEYVEALCARFDGQKDPSEELMEILGKLKVWWHIYMILTYYRIRLIFLKNKLLCSLLGGWRLKLRI